MFSDNGEDVSGKAICVRCTKFAIYVCRTCGDFYCSGTCQRFDWRSHRYICKEMPKLVLKSVFDNEVIAVGHPLQKVSQGQKNNCLEGEDDRNSSNDYFKSVMSNYKSQQKQNSGGQGFIDTDTKQNSSSLGHELPQLRDIQGQYSKIGKQQSNYEGGQQRNESQKQFNHGGQQQFNNNDGDQQHGGGNQQRGKQQRGSQQCNDGQSRRSYDNNQQRNADGQQQRNYDGQQQQQQQRKYDGQQQRNYDGPQQRNNNDQQQRNYDGPQQRNNSDQQQRNYDGQQRNNNDQQQRNYDGQQQRNNNGQQRNQDGQQQRNNNGQQQRNYDGQQQRNNNDQQRNYDGQQQRNHNGQLQRKQDSPQQRNNNDQQRNYDGQQQRNHNGQQQRKQDGPQQRNNNDQQRNYDSPQQRNNNNQQQRNQDGSQQGNNNQRQHNYDGPQQRNQESPQQQHNNSGQKQRNYDGPQQRNNNDQQQRKHEGQQQRNYNGQQHRNYEGQQHQRDYNGQQDRNEMMVDQNLNLDSQEINSNRRSGSDGHQRFDRKSYNDMQNSQKPFNANSPQQGHQGYNDESQNQRQSNKNERNVQNIDQSINAPVLKPPFEIRKFDENLTSFLACVIDTSSIREGMFACIHDKDYKAFINMQMYLTKMDKGGLPYKPVLNEYCIALFEDEWYRAKVIGTNNNEFKVEYIDFTNKGFVKTEDIRRYPAELNEIYSTSLCKLAGLPENPSGKLLNELENMIVDFQRLYVLTVKKYDEFYEIECPVLLKQLTELGLI